MAPFTTVSTTTTYVICGVRLGVAVSSTSSVASGSVWLPRAQSVRFIVGFWWMYCIVVMATYSGNLIAYLTVTKTELPFDTLEEMVAADGYKFGLMGGTVNEHLFRVSNVIEHLLVVISVIGHLSAVIVVMEPFLVMFRGTY